MNELCPHSNDKPRWEMSGTPYSRHRGQSGTRPKAPSHSKRLVTLGISALVAAALSLPASQHRSPPGAGPSAALASPQDQIPGSQAPPTRGLPSIPDLTRKQKEEMLKDNFAKMKNNVDELAKLARSLQEDVDKSNANVLSIRIVDKADKIEKLAHKIKATAKGF